MYEDRTQNYDQEIHEEYLIHETPFSPLHPCADYSIAIHTTYQTERQQFSAVTESKIWMFKGFSLINI